MRGTVSTVVVAVTVIAAIGLGLSAAAGSSGEVPTKGTVPESAFREYGRLDPSQMPDFVETLGPDGERVGYTRREDALGMRGPTAEPSLGSPTPVYADDLKTVVGYMHPGVGFVAAGEPVPNASSPPTTALGPAKAGG